MSRHAFIAAQISDTAKGLVGSAVSIASVIASWQEQLEWGLRILALVLGCVASVYTIHSIRRRARQFRKQSD